MVSHYFAAHSALTVRRSSFALGATCLLSVLCGCGSGMNLATTAPTASKAVSAVSNGPQLGYVWNPQDQTFRPFLGVPGASQVGDSVVPAGKYVDGASSSPANVALLLGADGQVYRMSLPTGTPSTIGVAAASGMKIRFSPDGSSALLFVPGAQTATVVANPATTPTTRSVAFAAPLLDAAVSDKGTVSAFMGLAGASSSIAVGTVDATGAPRSIGTVSGAGGISFSGGTEDVLFADSGANTLTLVRSSSTNPVASAVSTGSLVSSPVGVGVSLNGHWGVVANGGDASAIRVDLSGASAPQRLACSCQPSGVAQLMGTGAFRFTGAGNGPTWIADVTASTPAMMFIPALPAASGTTKATVN